VGREPKQEQIIYGSHACAAVFRERPQDIIRAYIRKDRIQGQAEMLKYLAAHKLAYHVLSAEVLEKICHSVHHDGLAILSKKKHPHNAQSWKTWLQKQPQSCPILWCAGLQNPHNLGAIVRSAAHFGFEALVISGFESSSLPAAATRVAMGGSEVLEIWLAQKNEEVLPVLKSLQRPIYTTSSHGGEDILSTLIPKDVIVVFGSESLGVSEIIDKSAKGRWLIPGTGLVESLNVSVAAGIFMARYAQLYPRA
jgi:TrmH RNA methyltransferase